MTGMDKGQIAILHFTCPPVVGGVEVIMGAHARLFAQAGYRVNIIAGRGPVPENTDERISTTIETLVDSKNERLLQINRELDTGKVPEDFAVYEQELYERLRILLMGYKACIVHNALTLHKNLPLTAALLRLAENLPETRFISWCHDLAWTNPLYADVLYEREPWTFLKKTSPHITYIAISPQRQQEILATFRPELKAEQVPVVPNGVALLDFLKIGSETQEILAAAGLAQIEKNVALLLIPARITRRKNIELAIKVAAELRAQNFGVRMVVTGPPGPHNPKNDDYVKELWALRAELAVEQEVIFLMEKWQDTTGRPLTVADEVIADLYRYCDALFFPSAQEGFGIPILEAGLVRLPIFTSNLAPIKDVAGELVHYFEAAGDSAQIASLIINQLGHNQQYKLRRTVLEKYTWEAIFSEKILPLVVK